MSSDHRPLRRCQSCGRSTRTRRLDTEAFTCSRCEVDDDALAHGRWVQDGMIRRWVPARKKEIAPLPSVKPTRKLQPCGSEAAYRRHLAHGEKPCDECRTGALAARAARRTARKQQRPVQDTRPDLPYYPDVVDAVHLISEITGTPVADIVSPGQTASDERAVAMWLARLAGMKLADIGDAFGRHHTTALNAIRNVDTRPHQAHLARRALDEMRQAAA